MAGRAAKRCWRFILPCLEATVSWGWPDLVSKAVNKVKDSLGSPYRQGWSGGDSSHSSLPTMRQAHLFPASFVRSGTIWVPSSATHPSQHSLSKRHGRETDALSLLRSPQDSQPLTLQLCFKPPTNAQTCPLKPGRVLWKAFFVLPAAARIQKRQQRGEEKNTNLDKWWLNAPHHLLPSPDQTVQKRAYTYYHWLLV